MAGDGEFPGMDEFGNGELQGVPIGVATLTVGRNGIMDLCLYSMGMEILLQAVAMFAENREDMPHAVAIRALRNTDKGIVHLINIYRRDFLAALIAGIE